MKKKTGQFIQVTYEELKLTKTLGADGFLLQLHLRSHINRDPKHKWFGWSWPGDVLLAVDLGGWGEKRLRAARKWLERCGAVTLKKKGHGWRYLIHLDRIDRSLTVPNPYADRSQSRIKKPVATLPRGRVVKDPSPIPRGEVATLPRGRVLLNREIEIEKPQEGGEDSLPPFAHLYLPHEIEDKLTIAGAEFHLALRGKGPMAKLNAEEHKREYLDLLRIAKEVKQKARKGKEEGHGQ